MFFFILLIGFAKLITKPMGLEGELNDVRAANSPMIEWCVSVCVSSFWFVMFGLILVNFKDQ